MIRQQKSASVSATRRALKVTPNVPPEVVAMVKSVVEAVQPVRVLLFGSYARGDAHRWSDVDLLVIIPDERGEREVWVAARRALRGSALPYDLVVATGERVRRLGNLVGTVFRPALREGRVLYDATARLPWRRDGYPVAVEVDPVTEELRFAETRRWLRQALADLRTAEVAVQRPDLDPDPACYLAQQAAEKALKAVLVYLQIDYPFTHDLDVIRGRIPDGWPVKAEFVDLGILSDWSYKARYPGDWLLPTARDAQQAVDRARSIYEAVLRDLRDRGLPAQADQ